VFLSAPPWIVSFAAIASTVPLTAMNCGFVPGTPVGVTVFHRPAVLPTATMSSGATASIVVAPAIERTAIRSAPPVVVTSVVPACVLTTVIRSAPLPVVSWTSSRFRYYTFASTLELATPTW